MSNENYVHGREAYYNKDYAQAIAILKMALTDEQPEPDTHYFLGASYFLSNDIAKAIHCLGVFVNLTKDMPDKQENRPYAYDLFGQCFQKQKNYAEALTCFRNAIALNPACYSAWHNMAVLYLELAEANLLARKSETAKVAFDNALIVLKNALISGQNHPAWLNTAALWYEKYVGLLEQSPGDKKLISENIIRNFNHAADYYQEALARCGEDDLILKNIIESNYTECLAQHGHHLYREGKHAEAQAKYQIVIVRDPQHTPAINQMGMSYFREKKYTEARAYFTQLLNIPSQPKDYGNAWLNIARTHCKEKNFEDAESALKQALRYKPSSKSIQEELKLIRAKIKPGQLTLFSSGVPTFAAGAADPQLSSFRL